MAKLNFRKASEVQLREIAYNDVEACWADKAAAEAELIRRKYPKRYGRVNYKQNAVYPR